MLARGKRPAGREGKSEDDPEMNERGESDGLVVPGKPSNKAGQPAVEKVEGRGSAKGKSLAGRTRRRGAANSALERVGQAAGRDRRQKFTALLQHVYEVERLRKAYRGVNPKAAEGVDGQTWIPPCRSKRESARGGDGPASRLLGIIHEEELRVTRPCPGHEVWAEPGVNAGDQGRSGGTRRSLLLPCSVKSQRSGARSRLVVRMKILPSLRIVA